jgi:lambda repressor-like predicted transcriptional regulator
LVEEVLREFAPQAVRPAEIRAALQRDKGTSLAYTSIRHALGQLEGRKTVEQDGKGGWRIALEAAS